jgi:hypothetical protein
MNQEKLTAWKFAGRSKYTEQYIKYEIIFCRVLKAGEITK